VTGFARTLSAEWLKRRRSLTGWLVLGSVGFIPGVIFLSRFRRIEDLPRIYGAADFWRTLSVQSWEAMVLMILPLSAMLVVTLVTQIESRNNAWKQVHAAPQRPAAVYAAKLLVILVLVAEMTAGYVVATYLSGAQPAVLFSTIQIPQGFSWINALRRSGAFFVEILPIVGLQYALAMRSRAFLPPLAVGMALWILSIGATSWRYNYLLPYNLAGIDYLRVEYARRVAMPADPAAIAAAWFLVFTAVGYVLYLRRGDKG
jgi:hypothetical protein